jgi:hypothetical protein
VHSVAYDDFCRRPDCAIESVAVLNELADKNPAVEEFELRSNRAENAVEEELVEKIRRMG